MDNLRLSRAAPRIPLLTALGASMVSCIAFGQWVCTSTAEAGALAEPQLFAPGVISTPGNEASATLSPDGRTLLFSRSGAILESHLRNGKWSVPEVAGFSGIGRDYYPGFSPDGSRIYFTSARPDIPKGGPPPPLGIWVVKRTKAGWSERTELGPGVNSPDRDGAVYSSVAADGTLFFGLGKGRNRHIMMSRLIDGQFAAAESLGEAINTTAFQGYHAVSPDGRFLILTSNRPGGLGGLDLYVSFNQNGVWTEPQNLGSPINTAADDSHAAVTADGRFLFFTSNRTCLDTPQEKRLSYSELIDRLRGTLGGSQNIYRIEIEALNLGARWEALREASTKNLPHKEP